jgi:beta-lactamase regulating signal transducer with metallopeptidase domain/prefoldin subunit 5
MNLFEVSSALLRASVAGGVTAAATLAVTAVWRHRIPASLRTWIWWLVAAHFLIALMPTQRIILPASTRNPALTTLAAPPRIAAEQTEVLATRVTHRVVERTPSWSPDLWIGILLTVWSLGMMFFVIRHIRGFRRMERAWANAVLYAPTDDERQIVEGGRTSPRAVELRVTRDFEVPVALAGLHPRILLPAEAAEMSDESRRLVLSHECAHLARRDLLFGWVPAVMEAIFWFHPLARWTSREYGQAREEACDARALLTTDASPRAYGELLVHFGVASRSLSTIASCGSPTKGALLRRLLMLDGTKSSSRWGRWAGVVLIVVAALSLVPLRLQATSEEEDDVESRTPAHLRIERFAYLLVQPDGNNMGGAMKLGGGYDDVGQAKKAQKKLGGGMIWWFRLDGSKYAVNDPETIASVRAVYEKQDELQSRLLGSFDERLEQLAGRMELLHPKMEQLHAKRKELDEEREDLEDARDEGKSRSQLDARLQKLESARQEIESSIDPLAVEQEQISREMETVSEGREEAYRKWEQLELQHRSRLREIAEDAVGRGVARKL